MPRDIGAYLKTKVSFHKTQEAITDLLQKHKVEDVQFTNTINSITLIFLYPRKINQNFMKLGVQITLTFPIGKDDKEKSQLKNQYYRALFYYLKSKLEAVEFGIRDFGEEFMADLMMKLPTGKTVTVKQLLASQIEKNLLGQTSEIKLLPE